MLRWSHNKMNKNLWWRNETSMLFALELRTCLGAVPLPHTGWLVAWLVGPKHCIVPYSSTYQWRASAKAFVVAHEPPYTSTAYTSCQIGVLMSTILTHLEACAKKQQKQCLG